MKKTLLILILLLVSIACAGGKDDCTLFAGARGYWLQKYRPLMKYTWSLNVTWDLAEQKTAESLLKTVNIIRSECKDATILSYKSACTTMPKADEEQNDYRIVDPAKLYIENIPSNWILDKSWSAKQPSRKFLDIRIPECRAAIITNAIECALRFNLDGIGWDNCFWRGQMPPNFPVLWEEWHVAFKLFVVESMEACKLYNLKAVYNIATFPDDIPEACRFVSELGGGFMTEMAFYHKNRTARKLIIELDAYKKAVDRGVCVLLFAHAKNDRPIILAMLRDLARNNNGYAGIYMSIDRQETDELEYLYMLPKNKK